METMRLWLMFDLGIKGDYNGLYRWLDQVGAKECGESLAFLKVSGEGNPAPLIQHLLKGKVKFRERDRVYLVYANQDGKVVGKFLFGKRTRAPWTGFAKGEVDEIDEGN